MERAREGKGTEGEGKGKWRGMKIGESVSLPLGGGGIHAPG